MKSLFRAPRTMSRWCVAEFVRIRVGLSEFLRIRLQRLIFLGVLSFLAAFVVIAAPVRAADVDVLIKQLKSADADMRRAAAKALAEAGAESKPAVDALA